MARIAIGEIRTSFGVKGELKVKSYGDDPGSWAEMHTLTLEKGSLRKDFALERCLRRGNTWTIKLKGIDSPEEARKFATWTILADEEWASPCAEGEYSCYLMQGSDLLFQGEKLGKIIGFVEGPLVDLLEVELVAGGVRLLPFQDEFIGEVDLDKKTVQLRVDWVLE